MEGIELGKKRKKEGGCGRRKKEGGGQKLGLT